MTDQQVLLRAALDAIPAYKPGKSAGADDADTYKISSNENPYPPLPGVLDAVAEAATHLNRYPDASAHDLAGALAEHLGVTAQEVCFGTGSSGVLAALLEITCEPGDEVVFAWRSFEMYPIVTALSGASAVKVPLDAAGRHDLPAMAEAVTDRTRLIILCSPNNPTGTVIHRAELEEFLNSVPSNILVVLDEAYLEFIRDEQAPDALEIYRQHANVVVLRTFSKAYGLAGLRVGYAVARPEVAEVLRKAIMPFGVSDMAQAAARESLRRQGELLERVDSLVDARSQVADQIAKAGVEAPETQANFIWLPLGERTDEFAEFAAQRGLIVRPFAGEGVRCTIAEPEANERLVQLVEEFMQA